MSLPNWPITEVSDCKTSTQYITRGVGCTNKILSVKIRCQSFLLSGATERLHQLETPDAKHSTLCSDCSPTGYNPNNESKREGQGQDIISISWWCNALFDTSSHKFAPLFLPCVLYRQNDLFPILSLSSTCGRTWKVLASKLGLNAFPLLSSAALEGCIKGWHCISIILRFRILVQ